jgi:hypothetical protein
VRKHSTRFPTSSGSDAHVALGRRLPVGLVIGASLAAISASTPAQASPEGCDPDAEITKQKLDLQEPLPWEPFPGDPPCITPPKP